jgi:hypothetical protein
MAQAKLSAENSTLLSTQRLETRLQRPGTRRLPRKVLMSGIADIADMVRCLHFHALDEKTWLIIFYTATGSEPAHGVGHNVPPTSTSTNYGPHSTNTGNKLDPRFDSNTDHRGTATGSTNAGPHSNNVANKLDPRIDSDQDHRNNPTSGMGPSAGMGSSNAGHHSSNLSNKLDPRVDSDMDHRANPTSNVGIQGAGAGGAGGVGSTNAGPHASNVGNKLDPRVDSDMDNRGNPASHVGGTGAGYR